LDVFLFNLDSPLGESDSIEQPALEQKGLKYLMLGFMGYEQDQPTYFRHLFIFQKCGSVLYQADHLVPVGL
jgi:hypothetical protein